MNILEAPSSIPFCFISFYFFFDLQSSLPSSLYLHQVILLMCIVWSVCFLQMCFLCAHIINDSERYYRISLFLPFCTQLFLRSRLYVVCGLKLLCSAPRYPPQKFPYTFSPGDGHYSTTTLGEHLYTCLLKDQGENFVGNIYPDMEFLDSGECTYFI